MNKDYDNYFGGCPKCGGADGCANVGKSHWFFCREHQTMWCVGSNLFGSWRDQTEEEQRAFYEANNLGSFEEVRPLLMLNKENKPIAGDRASYASHEDWFAVVLSKQPRPLQTLAWPESCTEIDVPF